MDAENSAGHHPETIPDTSTVPATTLLTPPVLGEISDTDFEEVVRGALESVGGTLLFKVKVGADDKAHHAAAAVVGIGKSRQFLLLTLPTRGGRLKVEPTSHSDSPLARIAESYAGLMDVLKAAA